MAKRSDQVKVVRAALEQAAKAPCLICKRTPAGGSGLWLPSREVDRWIIGTPPKKTRLILYALCGDCQATPGVGERIERRIRIIRLQRC